jgi:RNA polymerase sigma-70 factor, ECF subfamily
MDETKLQQFVELFVRNQNRIYRFIMTLIPNRTDADDLFQQTSLTLWRTWARYDARQDFVKWACGIAHNEVRNHLRKVRSPNVLLSNELLERLAALRLEHDDALEERCRALSGCLDKLPSRDRELLEQYYSRGETIKSVADLGGRSPNVLYKSMRRIRAALLMCVSQALAVGAGA